MVDSDMRTPRKYELKAKEEEHKNTKDTSFVLESTHRHDNSSLTTTPDLKQNTTYEDTDDLEKETDAKLEQKQRQMQTKIDDINENLRRKHVEFAIWESEFKRSVENTMADFKKIYSESSDSNKKSTDVPKIKIHEAQKD